MKAEGLDDKSEKYFPAKYTKESSICIHFEIVEKQCSLTHK